jgi:(+)-trans-carveol dehydrogenase
MGVWRTCKAAAQQIIASNKSASMVLTSSVGGLKGGANCAHYNASKHGVIGLMRTLAIEYAAASIRVNAVCPTNVNTPMLMADQTKRLFMPSEVSPSMERFAEVAALGHTLPVGWVEPEDVASAALFLASDEARYITGVALPVDAGAMLKLDARGARHPDRSGTARDRNSRTLSLAVTVRVPRNDAGGG